MVIGLASFLITLTLSILLVTTLLDQWLDPRTQRQEMQKQLLQVNLQLDSMTYELMVKDIYIGNIRSILSGNFDAQQIDSVSRVSVSPESLLEKEMPPIDSQFRANFENASLNEITFEKQEVSEDFRSIYLFKPMEGVMTHGYEPKNSHFGIDLVGKENEPVKSVADGVVIVASWTLDGGHTIGIQHRGGLVSIYKHNSELLKKVGTFVTGGEIIAITGNSGELTTGPHLHFEIWRNGNPLNPEEYVGL